MGFKAAVGWVTSGSLLQVLWKASLDGDMTVEGRWVFFLWRHSI